jgi:hypothetical protein
MKRIALAVAVALSLSLTPQVSGHGATFKSRVTIQVENKFNWHGRVKSKSPRCVGRRVVKVFTESGKRIVTTKSEPDGRWQTGLIGERYYAKVTREVRGGAGHRHVCKGDRSPTKSAPAVP